MSSASLPNFSQRYSETMGSKSGHSSFQQQQQQQQQEQQQQQQEAEPGRSSHPSTASSQLSLTSQPSVVSLNSQPSSSLISQLSSATTQSEISTNASESAVAASQFKHRLSKRLVHAGSLPSYLERGESFHSQLSSPEVSSFLSFGSSCQLPGIQGALSGCIKVLQAHQGHVLALTMLGDILYSGSSSNNNIHAWRFPEFDEVCRFGKGDGAVKSLLAVNSNRIISTHQDHKIRVWERTSSSSSPGLREDHKLVATLPTMKNVLMTFISPRNYRRVRRHRRSLWIQHSDTISVLAASPDKNVIYSGSWDKTFKVWRLSDFKCLESVDAHNDAVNALVASKAGYVYTGSADSKIKVWEKTATSKNHALVATLEGHKSAVNAFVLSPDELILYSASSDRRIMIWEREDSANHMSLLGALRGHRQAVLCLAVVDDLLCSGSADRTIRVWRRGTNNVHSCLALLEGHVAPVKAVCVSPGDYHNLHKNSNRYVVYSGSLDADVRVWLVSADEFLPSEGNHPKLHPYQSI